MKKIKYLLIAIIAFIIPLVVFAKTSVEGTDIVDIKVPENWRLYTKENLSETMTWLGFDAARQVSYKYAWTTNSYYFDLINEDKTTEIILINKSSDSQIDDLSIYQDEKIIDSFKDVKKEYAEYKPKVSLHTTASGIKYYKIQYIDATANLSVIDYITNIHGNMYQYKVQSNVELSKDLIQSVESIINSIEYNNYREFIEKNTITDEPKKSNNSAIIIIILLVLIIGGGVGVYIFLNKKKNSKKIPVETVYNPVQNNTTNPATAEFMNPSTPNTPIQSNNQEQPKQENNNINNGQ